MFLGSQSGIHGSSIRIILVAFLYVWVDNLPLLHPFAREPSFPTFNRNSHATPTFQSDLFALLVFYKQAPRPTYYSYNNSDFHKTTIAFTQIRENCMILSSMMIFVAVAIMLERSFLCSLLEIHSKHLKTIVFVSIALIT